VLVVLARNRLHRREIDHHRKAGKAPHEDRDDGPQRDGGIAQRSDAGEVDSEGATDGRHDSEERRVHEFPDGARSDRREDERGDERDPEQRPAPPRFCDEHGKQQSEARLEHDGGRREDKRVREALPEDRVAEQGAHVVLETHGPRDLEALGAVDAQVQPVDQRVEQERSEEPDDR
jgi:hypothetical protein